MCSLCPVVLSCVLKSSQAAEASSCSLSCCGSMLCDDVICYLVLTVFIETLFLCVPIFSGLVSSSFIVVFFNLAGVSFIILLRQLCYEC